MLKKYYSRREVKVDENATVTSSYVRIANMASVNDNEVCSTTKYGFSQGMQYPVLKHSDNWKDVYVGDCIN